MATLRFLLNGAPCSEQRAPPCMTVLDYLRGVRRLTGTKEGCAEGDCGACTIAVAWPGEGRLRYRAVNSCLMLLPQLDGASVVTVEGLAGPDGALHPVQRALVETDGTQCGFCTPGFAMAMFAFHQDGEQASDENIHEALAGNLCRCTGYRPIVDACRRVAGHSAGPHPIDAAVEAGLAKLALDNEYSQGSQRFFAPRNVDTLIKLLGWLPDAVLLSGGTDLGLLASKERRSLPVVISTALVPELKEIRFGSAGLKLGSAVTYSEVLPQLDKMYPSFGALVRRIGSRQIRNLGTIAGNIATASPIGDTLPCLIALQATVRLRSMKVREMPVEEFVTGYRKTALDKGEFIESVSIPPLEPGQRFFAYKLSKRFDQDIAAVIAAFRLRIANGAVAELGAVYGGMAATPKRATTVEAALAGKPWTAETLAGIDAVVARDFAPMDDQRASAAYRLRAAANLLRRLHAESTGAPAVRVEAL
ncbi:MAG: xanthine dehydrogenase small subunit [Rhodospirillales bacterium]